MKTSFILMCLVIITSCASNRMLPETKNLNKKFPDKGFLMGSISVRNVDRYYDNYEVIIRKIGQPIEERLVIHPEDIVESNDEGGTYRLDSHRGAYFVLALSPGEYEAYSFSLNMNSSLEGRKIKSSKTFSIPFTIKSGQANYVGEFVFNQPTLMEYLSNTNTKVKLDLKNNYKRDMLFLEAKYPEFNWANLVTMRK